MNFGGTYDDHWQKTRAPLLAADMDDRWFQCAPVDQQCPQGLSGGEPVILLNLSPRGRVQFVLPKIYLGFETRYYDGSREIHKNRALHTVILEADHDMGPREPGVAQRPADALQCTSSSAPLSR